MKSNTLLIAGGAVAAYFLFIKPKTTAVTTLPGGTTLPPGSPIPTTYGINGGYSGPNAAVVSNYAQILAANPNIGNPNYQLTPAEAQQYAANYADISQGVATWPGGLSQANLQKHWSLYGCAQRRIFLPLQPPSTANFIPPVNNPNSSGGSSSWVGSAIGTIGSIALAILGTSGEKLNNAECQLLITGGLVIKDILPMYAQNNPQYVDMATAKLNDLLTQYT
jgi:hypothetical protein